MFYHLLYVTCCGMSSRLINKRRYTHTARILCRSFMPKCHRQLRVKDLPKVPTWQLEWDSKPRPFGQKVAKWATTPHSTLRVLCRFRISNKCTFYYFFLKRRLETLLENPKIHVQDGVDVRLCLYIFLCCTGFLTKPPLTMGWSTSIHRGRLP